MGEGHSGGTHVSKSQEHGIKVQEYSKEDEEDAEAGGTHTDLCNGQGSWGGMGFGEKDGMLDVSPVATGQWPSGEWGMGRSISTQESQLLCWRGTMG